MDKMDESINLNVHKVECTFSAVGVSVVVVCLHGTYLS